MKVDWWQQSTAVIKLNVSDIEWYQTKKQQYLQTTRHGCVTMVTSCVAMATTLSVRCSHGNYIVSYDNV